MYLSAPAIIPRLQRITKWLTQGVLHCQRCHYWDEVSYQNSATPSRDQWRTTTYLGGKQVFTGVLGNNYPTTTRLKHIFRTWSHYGWKGFNKHALAAIFLYSDNTSIDCNELWEAYKSGKVIYEGNSFCMSANHRTPIGSNLSHSPHWKRDRTAAN